MANKPTTITADDGTKYQIVPREDYGEYYLTRTKLLPQEEKAEKHTVHLAMSYCDGEKYLNGNTAHMTDSDLYRLPKLEVTELTAQALADAIKALVEYVHGLTEFDDPWKELVATVSKAREAYQKEQS